MCSTHKDLTAGLKIIGPDKSYYWVETLGEAGITWTFTFKHWDALHKACPYECEPVYMKFADSQECAFCLLLYYSQVR